MENFEKIRSGIQVDRLLKAIDEKSHLWNQITARQSTPGSPHKDTQSIFLRGPCEQTVHAVFNEIYPKDYPALKEFPEARDLIHCLADDVNARELGRVMIVKLLPGGFITPHCDEGAYADHFERFHIVLASNEDCWFQCNHNSDEAEFVRMKAGESWWFNHKREHTFMNNGATDRIHLIVDAMAPRFKRQRDA